MKHAFLLFVLAAFALTGCSSLMVSVNDVDESAASLKTESGKELGVAMPTLMEGLEEEIADAGYNGATFTESIRAAVMKELESHGVKPVPAGDASPNTLTLRVTRFERGIGFFRLVPLFGLGDSYLTIHAVLRLPEGKREIVAEKVGQITGTSQMGDQTDDNISFVSTAIASRLTK